MSHKYFKAFEDFFHPKTEIKKTKKKMKYLKPIENYEQQEQKEREKYNQEREIGHRAANLHGIGSPGKI